MSFTSEHGKKGEKIYDLLFPLHEIDSFKGEELKSHILNSLEDTDVFIIDFSKIAYMNSSGLREMIQILKLIKEHQKTLFIAGVSNDVKKVFIHTNLDRLFTFYDSIADAVNMV